MTQIQAGSSLQSAIHLTCEEWVYKTFKISAALDNCFSAKPLHQRQLKRERLRAGKQRTGGRRGEFSPSMGTGRMLSFQAAWNLSGSIVICGTLSATTLCNMKIRKRLMVDSRLLVCTDGHPSYRRLPGTKQDSRRGRTTDRRQRINARECGTKLMKAVDKTLHRNPLQNVQDDGSK